MKGGNAQTEIVKSFKNKPNNKKKKKKKGGQQGNPKETAITNTAVNVKVEIPKTAAEASSNWATLVRASEINMLECTVYLYKCTRRFFLEKIPISVFR